MRTEELSALVGGLDTARFTLEDAMREGAASAAGAGAWVAYLYEHRTGLTYRVADYPAYRDACAYLPTAWIVHQPRAQRTGRDEGARAAALTRADVREILVVADGAACPMQAFHVRYDEHDDDRYVATVCLPDGTLRDAPTLGTYRELLHAARCPPGPLETTRGARRADV